MEPKYSIQKRPTGIFTAALLIVLHAVIGLVVAIGVVSTIFFGHHFPSLFGAFLEEGFTNFVIVLVTIHCGFSLAATIIAVGIFMAKKWSYYGGITFLIVNMLYVMVMNLTFFSFGISVLNMMAIALLYGKRDYFFLSKRLL